MSKASSGGVAIVTIHGTGDTANGPDGDKWFQRTSTFSQRLVANLAAANLRAEVIPFLWSGENSARAREDAANKLGNLLAKTAGSYDHIHMVAHSHGGNVAVDAVKRTRILQIVWRFISLGLLPPLRANSLLPFRGTSITTVGTPFLIARNTTAQLATAVVFSALSLICAGVLLFSVLDTLTHSDARLNNIVPLIASMLGVALMYVIAIGGLYRLLAGRMHRAAVRILFAIWHPNDEAISFLQRVQAVRIEPLPPGNFWRNSRLLAIALGTAGVLLTWVLAAAALVTAALGYGFAQRLLTFLQAWSSDHHAASWILSLFRAAEQLIPAIAIISPAIFILIYAATRLVGWVLDQALRTPTNNFVAGALRGMSFGRDTEVAIAGVSISSGIEAEQTHVIDGPVALRMQELAAVAANKLLDKYRWALFSVGAEKSGAINDVAMDAMTWDSLIHTTYFDQPEICDLIARNILSADS